MSSQLSAFDRIASQHGRDQRRPCRVKEVLDGLPLELQQDLKAALERQPPYLPGVYLTWLKDEAGVDIDGAISVSAVVSHTKRKCKCHG